MHLLMKLVANPSQAEAVISTLSRSFDVRGSGSMAHRRAVVCQRVGEPRELLYITSVPDSEAIHERLQTIEPALSPLLDAPVMSHWCQAVTSFRRWSTDPTVVVCGVFHVPSNRSNEVVEQLMQNGRDYRAEYAGLVAHDFLIDEADPGFLVLLHEWRSIDELSEFRHQIGRGIVDWVQDEIGGRYNRYEYHLRAAIMTPSDVNPAMAAP